MILSLLIIVYALRRVFELEFVDKMSELKKVDLVIKNFGAMQSTRKSSSGEKIEASSDESNVKKMHELIFRFYEKFKRKELEEKDFENVLKGFEFDENANVSLRNGSKGEDDDLDKVFPVDFELDFQDGEIKVTGASTKEEKGGNINEKELKKEGRPKTGKGNDEKQINKQMKHLMATFEQEKKNLLKKVELEKEIIAKQVADDYEKKLQVEKDFLGTVIADLVKSVEDAKSQVEELQMIREHDRMTLQKFFRRKLADERRKMMLEVTSKQDRA